MKNRWLFIVALPFVFAACDPEPKPGPEPEWGTLDVNFQGTYDGNPLVLYDFYDYPNDFNINFSTLIFYMSDVRLVKESGEEVKIGDVHLVNFAENHSLASTASNGETVTMSEIPEGEYSEIRFGIGISAALNATNPADYASDHPMSRTELYWDWRGTYIFAMIEGNLDTLNDNGATVPLNWLYHCGSDAMFEEVSISTDISIEINKTTDLALVLDAKKIFVTNAAYDIKTNSKSHSTADDAHIAADIIANLAKAIELRE